MVIRKFQAADLSQIMEIWLAGNISAHPFVEQSYWTDHRSMVHDALLEAEVLVAVDGPTVWDLRVFKMITLQAYLLKMGSVTTGSERSF